MSRLKRHHSGFYYKKLTQILSLGHAGIFERESIPSGNDIVRRRARPQNAQGAVITAMAFDIDTGFISASFEIQEKNTLIVYAIYRHNDLVCTEEICRQLQDFQKKHPKAVFWIAGDLNLHEINWKTREIMTAITTQL